MKKLIITARDKDGNLLGQREVDCPETVAECNETFDDKQHVKYCVSAWVIDVQDELRRAARSKDSANPLVKALKAATPAQRAAIEAKMRELGL